MMQPFTTVAVKLKVNKQYCLIKHLLAQSEEFLGDAAVYNGRSEIKGQ
ncbi:hypothetical protein AADZ86_11660 [Colwelliaceae bacterium BS250]